MGLQGVLPSSVRGFYLQEKCLLWVFRTVFEILRVVKVVLWVSDQDIPC